MPDAVELTFILLVQYCDGRHGYSNMRWQFIENSLHLTDPTTEGSQVCLDVVDGRQENGVKLQTWTCVEGSTNQQFTQTGGDSLNYPTNTFEWTSTGLCVDLTDGSTDEQLQLWACDELNTNQVPALCYHLKCGNMY